MSDENWLPYLWINEENVGCGPKPLNVGGPSCQHARNTPCACPCQFFGNKKHPIWKWTENGPVIVESLETERNVTKP